MVWLSLSAFAAFWGAFNAATMIVMAFTGKGESARDAEKTATLWLCAAALLWMAGKP